VKEIFEVNPEKLLMATGSAMRVLEAPNGSPAPAEVHSIIDQSREVFVDDAQPRGLMQSVTISEFDEIYRESGKNDDDTPLEHVVEEAISLALFAVTLGNQISDRITALFDGGELAEGYILDQVASFAADEMATIAGKRFQGTLDPHEKAAVLPYSPGYCGWHVAGQRPLFARLEPNEIGISLNDSCLMSPIKSVSGVLVFAPIEAHEFSPAFPCCATCTTLDCQERAASLRHT
jgi:hypothetical protein